MLLLRLHGIGVVGDIAFGNRIGKDALLLLGVVYAESGAQIESFERIEVEVRISEHPPIGIAVVRIPFEPRHSIFPVGIPANRAGIFSVLFIDRKRRIELQHILEKTAGGLDLGCAVDRKVFADRKNFPDKIVFGIHPRREPLEIRGLDDAEILVISEGEIGTALLGTVADGKIVVLRNACTGSLVEPVGVGSRSCAGTVEVFRHGDPVQHRIAVGIVAPVITVAQSVGVRVLAVIHVCLPHYLPVLFGIEYLHLVGVHGCRNGGVEVYVEPAALPFLRGNDYYAVGRTGTVD